jgi:hypothetical protein
MACINLLQGKTLKGTLQEVRIGDGEWMLSTTVSYGFVSDIVKESESYWCMKTMRYLIFGIKKFLGFLPSYYLQLEYIPADDDTTPLGIQVAPSGFTESLLGSLLETD